MNTLQNTWELLQTLSLLHWLMVFGVVVLSGMVYVWRYLKLQYGFAKNLKRKIYFLKTSSNKNLQTERDLIKNINLFNVHDDIKDISENLTVLQNLKPKSAFVVGYDQEYSFFEKLINEAKNKNTPVIIFARQGEIRNSEHWKIFNGYIYCDVANTPNRLSIILLNILTIIRS